MNARALDRCRATLHCSLSIFTVSQPSAPCHIIVTKAKLEPNLVVEEASSLRRIASQFRITSGPRITPANSLWNHSVNIWSDVYRCSAPLESISSGFSSHHFPWFSGEISNPQEPKHVGQSGQLSPASLIRIHPPVAMMPKAISASMNGIRCERYHTSRFVRK